MDRMAKTPRLTWSRCGVTSYPITSPSPYAVGTPTSVSTSPTATCNPTYTIQPNDTCQSICLSKKVSTFSLMMVNALPGYCSSFPAPGSTLCLPPSCDVYTVQGLDSCVGIANAFNASFTTPQLISWNPNINANCSNINMIAGYEICIRYVYCRSRLARRNQLGMSNYKCACADKTSPPGKVSVVTTTSTTPAVTVPAS